MLPMADAESEGGMSIDGREPNPPLDKPVTCPTLIGRARELATLSMLMATVKGGDGRIAIIGGEAGIGKSRLAAETRRVAIAQGFLVAQGQSFQADATYPYAPLLDLLRGYLSAQLPAIVADGQEPLARELVQVLPDLALLFPHFMQGAHSQTVDQVDPAQRRQRLFAILTHILISEARRQPTLLIVEDAHWCDEGSLDFLLYLARRITRAPILLLFTYRHEEVPPRLSDCLALLNREHLAQELDLTRLSLPEIDTMIDAMTQAIGATASPVRARLAQTIYTVTEGNPFFAEEALKSLMTAGALRLFDGKWKYTQGAQNAYGAAALIPRSVQGQVQQRMTRLSADARQALMLAAVTGRRFDFDVLQRLMACDESHLIHLMKELIAAQLVTEESADLFAFRHVMIQQAIYSTLLARERRSLHGDIANTLESLYTSPEEREAHLADLSFHFHGACFWAKALEYGQRAGEKVLTLYAPRAALEHTTYALEAAHHLHTTPSGKLYYMRGQAHATLGEFDRARGDYERALEHAALETDDTLQWQSMTALGFLWTERDYHQAGTWFRRASDLADRLDDPAMQARSLNRLGNWLTNTGRLDEALRAHQDALKIFEDHNNRQGIAETLDLLSTLHGMGGDRVTAVVELGRAIALFRALGDTPSLVSSLAMRALQATPGANETTYCPRRTRDECMRDASESLRLARQTGSQAGQAFAEAMLAQVLMSFGEFGPALLHAQTALSIASKIGHQQWMVSTSNGLGRTYVLLLAPGPALSALTTGLALARELGSEFWIALLASVQAQAHILAQNLPAAQETLRLVLPRDERPRTFAERNVALAWSKLALAQRDHNVALDIAEHLLATAPGLLADQPTQPIPDVLWVQGDALLGLSRLQEATTVLEEARRGAQQRNARPLLWMIHRSLGHAYQLLQRQDEAQREIAAGRRLIEELASTVTDGSLRDHFVEAANSSLPKTTAPSSQEAARQTLDGLTAREHEVAALVAEGKTNRQIADALVVSERTAEVHVSNILRKLGFASRTQVAVWAAGRGIAKG